MHPFSHHQLLLLLPFGPLVPEALPEPLLVQLCSKSQLNAPLSSLSSLVDALLGRGSSCTCQEAPLFSRAWENTPHLTLTPGWRGMLRPELEWDVLSWQAAFPCLGLSDGEGPRGSGTLAARGDSLRAPGAGKGQNPILGAHPPCQTLDWLLRLLLETLRCAVFLEPVPRSHPASLLSREAGIGAQS